MPWYVNSLFAEAAPQDASSSLVLIKLLVGIGTLAVSFFLGSYLGKKLRMPEHGWKIGLCLFTLFASVAVLLLGPKVKLGVDLSGGAILIYQVEKKNPDDKIDMDKLLDAIKKRVNPSGTKEVIIRTYGAEQIEVIIPEKEKDESEIAQIERTISQVGQLEFRILANNRDNKDLIERAKAEPSKMVLTDSEGKREAWWVPIRDEEVRSIASYGEIATRTRTKADGKTKVTEVLLVPDPYNVTGEYLARADVDSDEKGQPCVRFVFDSRGSPLFGQLTGNHLPDEVDQNLNYKLGITLDGVLYSAPSIRSTISTTGIITGTFTKEQVADLVKVLNAGSLPATLSKEPISKLYSGATLGQDTIEKSTNAMIIASILIPLFMLWYYRFSGLVADVALVLNMLILFALMLAFKAAFTLTGFAGLALTVGMAVDNNVLVYERLREELERGATLRMGIRNAFQRASATIVDANLTTLIAAIVMYVIGTDQIKGFAVPLGLGVAISMFTSVFVARVIFDIAEKRQWITKVKMLHVIGHTNIDFMKLFPYTLTATIIITVMAVVLSIHRGIGLLDIDFTGGVSVQAVFKTPQETQKVRELLSEQPEKERLPDLAVTDVRLSGQERGYQFVINTSEPSMKKVQDQLTRVFGKDLAYNSLTASAAEVIPSTPAKAATPAKEKETVEKPAEPAKKDQSRNDLLPRPILASSQADSLLLALADAKGTKPAEDKAAKPAETKAAKSPENPAVAVPVEVPGAAAGEKKPLPSETAEKKEPVENRSESSLARFANGTQVQLQFAEPLTYEAVKQLLTTVMEQKEISVESTDFDVFNDNYVEGERAKFSKWTLKIMMPPAKADQLVEAVKKHVAETPIFPASSTIGGAVAGKTRFLAVLSLTVSWLCMIIYLWIRFQGVAFGLAAVVALIHDVLVMLGAVAVSIYIAPYCGFLMIEPFKVNLTIVAAFLTIIGYSVNDTIIVFDRIRETRGKNPDVTREMVNDSVNQTLSRTLITSFTVFLVVVILYLRGGEAVHGFAFVLMIGVATGTYSSIYIASPILLWLVGKRHHVAALIER
jgi:SecD/SecF fusion protein